MPFFGGSALEDLVQMFLEARIELPPFLATMRRGRGSSSGYASSICRFSV